MKVRFVIVFCVLYSISFTESSEDENLELRKPPPRVVINDLWIEQPLDHFNETDTRVWNMRYFERDDMWQPGGPIILFIGGESEAEPYLLEEGMAYDLADETRGAAYMSEHRYYGWSVPIETMQYLSSRQALADLHFLIKKLKGMPKYKDSKVVVIGGSYAGNLAAWMRLLYPDSVDAAIASSAPVLAKLDFYEFMETVGDNYRTYGGNDCYNKIESIFKRYDELFKTPEGADTLKREENICEDSNMTTSENQQLFTYHKAGRFRDTSMLGNTQDIKHHCDELLKNENSTNTSQNLYRKQIKSMDLDIDWDKHNNCMKVSVDSIRWQTNYSKYSGEKTWLTSWIYQSCTEFSYARTTSSDNQPFGKNIPLSSFYLIYSIVCGPEFNEEFVKKSIKETNDRYGGQTPNVTKVVFLNGDMDPWHRLGVTKDLSDEAPAILIPKASHCQDLSPATDGDSAELTNARQRAKALVKSWIGFGG